jgi:hypothetical protein
MCRVGQTPHRGEQFGCEIEGAACRDLSSGEPLGAFVNCYRDHSAIGGDDDAPRGRRGAVILRHRY